MTDDRFDCPVDVITGAGRGFGDYSEVFFGEREG